MSIIGGILIAVGSIICLVYGIIILIKAFKEHILWGLGYLFVPFVGLVFIIKYWDKCKKPFLMLLLGVLIEAIGFGLMTPSMIKQGQLQMEGLEQQLEQQGQAIPNQ